MALDFEKAVRERNVFSGNCTLGKDAMDCSGTKCAACGWNVSEVKRRAALPLKRNSKGLWEKQLARQERKK